MVAQLPIELLQIIFQDAEPRSLRAHRLVDRQWCAASTPYAFSRYHASLFSRSLTKFTALAQSPLAKHVKTIEFHTDQLPHYTRKEHEAKIDLRPNISTYRTGLGEQVHWSEVSRVYNKLPMHDYTPAQLEKGWLAFQTYCSEQKRWIDGQAGLVLEDCLSRLHNLSEVVISKAKPFGGPLNNTPFWRNFMDEILVGPDAWTYGHNTSYQYEALSTMYIMTAIGRRIAVAGVDAVEKLTLDLPDPFSFYHMIHLPPSSAGVIPKEFRERGYTGADPDQSHLSSRYNVIVDAFRPLKHLALWGPSVIEDDLDGPGALSQAKETAHFLMAAVNLRSLALDIGEPSHSYEGASDELDLSDCSLRLLLKRSNQTYPHLEDLRISSAFSAKLFKRFLILHKDTLRRLDIRDCLCDDWDKVLKTIAKDLKLDHIYVESLWSPGLEDNFEEEGESFILGEGLDADDEFARDLKAFLRTGEGSMPRIDDYERSDSDDGHNEKLYATYAVDDPMGGEEDDDEDDESLD
ncbi:hypothetical protein Q7P35_006577 [Cladosporium inversicolor]